jgi:hypothetical protein
LPGIDIEIVEREVIEKLLRASDHVLLVERIKRVEVASN